jgi:hypothetical protein
LPDSAGLSLDIRHHALTGGVDHEAQLSRVQKKKAATARPKAHKVTKVARGKATKRTVPRAKPKRVQVKKAVKPVTAAVETVAVEESSILAPGVTTITEAKEADAPQAS